MNAQRDVASPAARWGVDIARLTSNGSGLALWTLSTDWPLAEVLKPSFWRLLEPGRSGLGVNDIIEAVCECHGARRTHARLIVVRAVAGEGCEVRPLGEPVTFEVDNLPWWDELGVTPKASEADIIAAYRERSKSAHPDKGGTEEGMATLNRAKEEGVRTARALRAAQAA